MILALKRNPAIYLVGFMGSGKSTIGRRLAAEIGWPFQDLDAVIEAREHTTISELFAQHGEPEFRRRESEALREAIAPASRGVPLVLALGGGAFSPEVNRASLKHHGITIWLDCPLDVCRARIAQEQHRPLARDPAAFAALYQARQPIYALADYRIDASQDDAAAVQQIFALGLVS